MRIISRITCVIPLLLFAVLIVPTVHAQDTTSEILYAVRDDKGDNTIYRINADDGLKTQVGVVHRGDSDAGWSPDGKFIYLLDYAESYPTLTLVNAETNQRQTIPDHLVGYTCSPPLAWSPHAEWLTYLAADSDPILKILNPTTGEIQILTDANYSLNDTMWSPDGRYFTYGVFSESQDGRIAIWDVQEQRIITELDYSISLNFPQWSPVENRLFYRDAHSKNTVVYNIVDGTEQKYPPIDRFGGWSPDGRFLTIYTESSHDTTLSVIDVLADKVVHFGDDIDQANVDSRTAWSSDGRYLAVATIDTDNNDRVYILDVINGSSQPLHINPRSYNLFTWSPVADQLAFAYNLEYFNWFAAFTYFWVFDADSQQSRHYLARIPLMSYERTLDWSPAGRYLIVRGDDAINLLDWTSAQLSPITGANQNIGQPRWSADGSQIALSSGGLDTGDLYIFNIGDKTLKNLTNSPDEVETFLGWRGAQNRESLISCGEG